MASDRPVIQGYCNGVPIRRFGFTWVLDEAPDLVDDVPLQAGNDAPRTKVHPKQSSEIRNNRIGATTTRMPRSPENDYLPQEAIHLIDGDVQTGWSSRGQRQPNVEPVWIRLDLPVERVVDRVVLRKRPLGFQRTVGMVAPEKGSVETTGDPGRPVSEEVGRGMAGKLTIKVSRDGWHWDTVFEGPTGDSPEREEFVFGFEARPAKQVWITGEGFPRVENWLYAFSIAEVEVLDPTDRNVALATTGTGVTVNSTMHGFGLTTTHHRWLWPLHWYSGFKWARVGYHDDPINWHWVEKEKGKLAVDPETDQAITELAENGVNVVMALGFGNRLYTQEDPSRKLPQLWEWYYENPKPPTTPEALAAWGRFVRYMAEHFRDRVTHFEVWNEWNIPVYWGDEANVEQYIAIARVAIPILREVCPGAKIMLGSWAGFPHGIAGWDEQQLSQKVQAINYLAATRILAKEVDEIGWHPFYGTDPDTLHDYVADARALMAWLKDAGFRGHCMVTEWSHFADYPAGNPGWGTFGAYAASELEKAKYIAQVHTKHTGLGLESFFCEMFHTDFPLDLTLTRRSFTADPIAPHQVQAAWYVSRNLATALEDLDPADFAYRLEGAADVEAYPMQRVGEQVLALWLPGRPQDHCAASRTDIWIGVSGQAVTAYEPLNGTEQSLVSQPEDGGIWVREVLLRDYPLLLKVV